MRDKRLVFTIGILVLVTTLWCIGVLMVFQFYSYKTDFTAKQTILGQALSKNQELQRDTKTIEADIAQKDDELKAKQAELDKLNTDLQTKLKQLDTANKKIQAQQSQLASESSELDQLRSRPADQPPLFN